MPEKIICGAQMSNCRLYRYSLWRTWREGGGHVMFIGLNPSTANEIEDDPTIRRCIGYARDWDFGGMCMLNLFAYRATNPKELKKASDPIGPLNNDYLQMYLDPAGLTIACWGVHGTFLNRGQEVIDMLCVDNLSCLGITKNKQPKHPLYLKRDIEPIKMSLFRPIDNEVR